MHDPISPQDARAATERADSARRRWPALVWALALAALVAIVWGLHVRAGHLRTRLLALNPDTVVRHPDLVRFAVQQARPLFAAHCARCHGKDMRGNTAIGAPDLTDRVWLYGNGSVFAIERTVLYGVRSGNGKSHHVTKMTAYGTRGMLTDAQIRNVVQYVLQLSGRPHRALAAAQGETVYYGKADCGDCHGSDARGNADYGSPDLTADVFNSGGDAQSIYDSIYYGRYRTMPAWIDQLSLEQIRALAVYVYTVSHP